MLKKVLSKIVFLGICMFFGFYQTNALDIGGFSISANNNDDHYFNPGGTFSLDIYTSNESGEEINDARLNVIFSDNASFDYSGTKQKTHFYNTSYIDTDVLNPVPASYYSLSGLSVPVSNASVAGLYGYMFFSRIGNDHSSFSISNSISSYSNTIEASFSAKKVSDSSSIQGTTKSKNIYINVKPHIIDKYFSKSGTRTTSIKGGGTDSIDFFMSIKDYNGCSNIDTGAVTADLTSLGLGTSESLTYDSCGTDTKTALFKKSGITTTVSIGTKILTHTNFTATDEDSNSNDASDSNFAETSETDSLTIDVETPSSPTVTSLGLTDNYIGGSGQTSTTLSFSADQSGSSKVSLNSCSETDSNKIFEDITSYTSGTTKQITIQSSKLSEGSNTVFACVGNGTNTGSINVSITKDTTFPSISGFSNTVNITSGNVGLGYACSENGQYKVDIINTSGTTNTVKTYSTITANTQISETIPNSSFQIGINTIIGYCRDDANNEVFQTGAVNKYEETPSMSGQVTNFSDNDNDNNGIDGRDITITWNTSLGTSFSSFELWSIYILPSNTDLDTNQYNSIINILDSGSGSFTGDNTITADSAGNSFGTGQTYKAYVLILGRAGEYGTPGEASTTFSYDTVVQADVTKAEFISDTKLKLYTDTTLDTEISSHSASLVSYQVSGNTLNPSSVNSISGQDIIFNIPSLSDTSSTGSNLVISTGAIHSSVGGFNNLVTASFNILDKQDPVFSSFTQNTSSIFGNFYNTTLNFSWNSSEELKNGNTFIRFVRNSGNSDNTTHRVNIPSSLGAGDKNTTIRIDDNTQGVSLNCGSTYSANLIGEDLAGNTKTSNSISISFDNCGPDTVNLNELTVKGTSDFNLTWNSSSDDNDNGSGIKNYNIELYTGYGCSTLTNSFSGLTTTSQSVSLSSASYSWKAQAIDNIGNIGAFSTCDNFVVDTSTPVFSNTGITDTNISNNLYSRVGDNIQIEANISNTNISNITANLSQLTGDSSHNFVYCSNPPSGINCNYSGTMLTYSFELGYSGTISEGLKQASINANNTNNTNSRSSIFSTTVDKSNPVIANDTITYPNEGEIVGNTQIVVSWDSSKISDTIGVQSVEISYLKSGTGQTSICNGANTGTCSWDVSSLNSGNDYSIKLSASDFVGNTTSSTGANFTIDNTPPIVSSNTIIFPNGGNIFKLGDSINILWNSGSIADSLGGLATNPISINYSTNRGTSYTQISISETNDGIFSWSVPNINSSENLIQLIASDVVGNMSSDTSDTTFIIDSTLPTLNIQFAGNGGTTPQNEKYINNSGIDLSLGSSDSYLDKVYYTFENTNSSTFWDSNTNSFSGTEIQNNICNDTSSLGTNNVCDSISSYINPNILDGNSYKLIFHSIDEASNIFTSSTINYTGDTLLPNLSILNSSGSYISNSLNISGTASDSGSAISSVIIQIKKGSMYWDGNNFVSDTQSLATNTSNNYANWNYNFVGPGSDNDGQDYEIIVKAFDNSFKDNNESTKKISIKKDFNGPSIGTGVISFPSYLSVLSGGSSVDIIWNTGDISDTISGVDSSKIKLSYFNGSSYINIVENTQNDGSYTWNIPSIDLTNVNIRLTATDNAGNSSFQNSESFVVDSTDPTIIGVQTMENGITNGKINSLQITFSENIKDTSLSTSGFSIDGGTITPTQITSGGFVNDNKVILLFSATGTTGTKPTLRYSGNSIEDFAGRKLQTTSTLNSLDKVNPRVQNIKAFDDNSNGKLDRINIVYSETISSSTSTSGLSIGNSPNGMAISSASISSNVISLQLSESNNPDSSTNNLTLSLNNSSYTDTSGNTVLGFQNEGIEDEAKPIRISSQTIDTDLDYKADTIRIIFSETMTGGALQDFTIENVGTGVSFSGINLNSSQISLTLNETTEDNDTDNSFSLSYSGTSLSDIDGNLLENISSHTSFDKIAPKIISRETIDSNGNGKIDSIKITTSENLNDNFSSINISATNYSSNGFNSNIANDNIFILELEEKSVFDTSVIPDLRIVSNNSLGDSNNNLLILENTGATSSDKVGPVIIGANYQENSAGVFDDEIFVDFSENISSSSIDTSFSGSQNDFEITITGELGSNSKTTIISNTKIKITLGTGATALNPGSSKVGIKTNALTDINGNMSPSISDTNRVILSSFVIINEIMFSSTTNNQYIELKNIGSTSVDIGGWTIKNAGGNNVDLEIGSGSISGGEYFLIAKKDKADSLLDISPDIITDTLNLNPSSQNNLVLEDRNSIVFDSVISSPWPSGDATNQKSMERKENPGDGLETSSWYTAETSNGFDNTSINGTPKTANVFDGVAPTINSQFPSSNALLPLASFIRFDYSDSGVGIDDSSANISLQKRNGSSYVSDSNSNIINSDVNESRTIFSLSDLDFGRYRVQFNISDNAGNTVNKEIIFYIDKFSISILGNNLGIGNIESSVNNFSSGEVVITIKTLGAPFSISQNKNGFLSVGTINIGDFSDNYGFGYDINKSENGIISNYLNTITPIINSGNIVSISEDIDTNGNLKTYIYKLKYGVRIGGLQEAGIYKTDIFYEFK